jgi:hypothetical protein
MHKGKLFRSFLLHLSLEMLAWEAATLVLSFLLFRLWNWLQRFSDVLFLVGVLELMAAGVGMLGRPYEVSNSPWGVFSSPVKTSEDEKRWQSIATLIEQRSFALRMIICGALTFLLAAILSYSNH